MKLNSLLVVICVSTLNVPFVASAAETDYIVLSISDVFTIRTYNSMPKNVVLDKGAYTTSMLKVNLVDQSAANWQLFLAFDASPSKSNNDCIPFVVDMAQANFAPAAHYRYEVFIQAWGTIDPGVPGRFWVTNIGWCSITKGYF